MEEEGSEGRKREGRGGSPATYFDLKPPLVIWQLAILYVLVFCCRRRGENVKIKTKQGTDHGDSSQTPCRSNVRR